MDKGENALEMIRKFTRREKFVASKEPASGVFAAWARALFKDGGDGPAFLRAGLPLLSRKEGSFVAQK
jgi:hypothetical protein